MTSTTLAEPSRRFRPELRASVLAGLACLVLLGLGTWQVQRLHWKEGLIATIRERMALPPLEVTRLADLGAEADYRRATVRGSVDPDHPFRFGSVAQDGRIGARLLQPLTLASGETLLVDRGWIGEGDPVPAETAAGPISGVLRWHGQARQGWFVPDNDPVAGRWYWWDLGAMGRSLGRELSPFVLEPATGRIDLPNNHLGYAITWYGLAAGLVAVYLAFSFRPAETPR
jgi:surfeit locus 1 family protein